MYPNGDVKIISTPIGNMIAIANSEAIVYLDFLDKPFTSMDSNNPLLLRLECELYEYFTKKREVFSLPLSPMGTEFQKNAWQILRMIVYGSTISYATQANMLKKPKACRATANANSKNPISILIPCHRVISSSGKIGGYSGGVWRKEFLIALENSTKSSK